MAIIEKFKCKEVTKFHFNELIELSGLKRGQHIFNDDDITIDYTEKYINILVTTKEITLVRRIRYKQLKIENMHIEVKNSNCGIGTGILQNQIMAASKHGFTNLTCIAYRREPIQNKPACIGYKVWCKMGYLMNSLEDLSKFQNLLKKNKIFAENLNHLITSVEGGADFWSKEGFRWKGYFDLEPGSLSRIIFESYKEKRNLN